MTTANRIQLAARSVSFLAFFAACKATTFLVTKGLGGDRVSTTSRAAMDAMGRDETTWANDRRVDMVLGS